MWCVTGRWLNLSLSSCRNSVAYRVHADLRQTCASPHPQSHLKLCILSRNLFLLWNVIFQNRWQNPSFYCKIEFPSEVVMLTFPAIVAVLCKACIPTVQSSSSGTKKTVVPHIFMIQPYTILGNNIVWCMIKGNCKHHWVQTLLALTYNALVSTSLPVKSLVESFVEGDATKTLLWYPS